jgi:hypothetical protein
VLIAWVGVSGLRFPLGPCSISPESQQLGSAAQRTRTNAKLNARLKANGLEWEHRSHHTTCSPVPHLPSLFSEHGEEGWGNSEAKGRIPQTIPRFLLLENPEYGGGASGEKVGGMSR